MYTEDVMGTVIVIKLYVYKCSPELNQDDIQTFNMN